MEVLQVFQTVCPWLLAAALIVAAASDLRSYEIPDTINAGIGILYFAYAMSAPGRIDFASACVIALIVFLVGVGLFSAGVFGGGDVKLLAATTLWAGPVLVLPFLVITALAGGLLSLVVLLRMQMVGHGLPGAAKQNVPYGVAIAAGGLYVAMRISSL
jgi:prepilin peptidase CpaA